MSSQHQDQDQEVGVGIDTHADVHMVGVIDRVGREIAHQGFPTTEAGYQQLETWIASWGSVLRIGMEGTGTYGAELCRQLNAHGFCVVEVDRADRKTRRFQGKSDPIDAYAAACSNVGTGICDPQSPGRERRNDPCAASRQELGHQGPGRSDRAAQSHDRLGARRSP